MPYHLPELVGGPAHVNHAWPTARDAPQHPLGSMKRISVRILVFALSLTACSSNPVAPSQHYEYLVLVNGERFVVRATDPATNRALEARRLSKKSGIIAGVIAKGDGSFNAPWQWHLVPESIAVPDVTIELCDGTPSMVEANVDAWMANTPRFCPWGAVVSSRREYVPASGTSGAR